MLEQIILFTILSVVFAGILSPFIINLLYKLNITRRLSRNTGDNTKVGTPIMGGLIFVIPILILGIIANYTVIATASTREAGNLFSGSIKILLVVFAISAILGGADDILNIYGKDRTHKDLKKVLKLIRVHKSVKERIKLTLLLPWYAYRSFFLSLGSHAGKGIAPHEKILVQLIVGILVALWINTYLGITGIWIPYIGNIYLGFVMFPFVVLTVMFMSNAANVSDGLDGLSAGLSLISFTGFLAVALFKSGNEQIATICAIAIGALLVYLYFNIKPARVQMGDIGSLAIGTLLASIAFGLNRPFLLIPFCGIFVIELFSSLLQGIGKRLLGRRILKMAPLHHHLELVGWSENKIVLRFWLIQGVLLLIGFLLV